MAQPSPVNCMLTYDDVPTQLNPHLEATFSSKAAGRGLLLPKQAAASQSAVATTGISSFAFQGTNAHAVLSQPSALPLQPLNSTNPAWQKHHISVLPPMHACMHSVTTAAKRTVATFEWQLHKQSSAYLYDHVVQGRGILPAAAYLEMVTTAVAISTAASSTAGQRCVVSGAVFEAPLLLPEVSNTSGAVVLRCNLDAQSGVCKLVSAAGAGVTHHMQGSLSQVQGSINAVAKHKHRPGHRHRSQQQALHVLSSILQGFGAQASSSSIPNQALGSLAVDSSLSDGYYIHPTLLDNSLQLAGAAAQAASGVSHSSRPSQVFVPASLQALTVDGHVAIGMTHATAHMGPASSASEEGKVVFDHTLAGGLHRGPVMQMQGMQSKALPQGALTPQQSHQSAELPLYAVTWQATSVGREAVDGLALSRKRVPLGGCSAAACSGAMQLASLMQAAVKAPQHSIRFQLQSYSSRPVMNSVTPEGSYQQAALWGMMRTFQQECPSVNMTGTDDHKFLTNQASSALLHVQTEAEAQAMVAPDGYGMSVRCGTQYEAKLLPVSQTLPASSKTTAAADLQLPNLAGGSVVITGGGGMIGSLVSRWLLQQGKPRAMKLLSRTGRTSPERTQAILGCPEARAGALISIAMCDISFAEDSPHCFGSTHNCESPISAIIHAGGTLADATVGNQNPTGIRAVFAPKVTAAQKWQDAVQQQPMQSQILFSSVAALLGAPGQLNYAAANAAMDTLAATWGAQGQAGVSSIQWGGWAGGGMASGDAGTAARLARMGMPLITPSQGLAALASVMLGHTLQPQRSAALAATSFKWDSFMRNLPPGQSGIFAEFELPAGPAGPAGSAGSAQPQQAGRKLTQPRKKSPERAVAKPAVQTAKPAAVSAATLEQVAAAVTSVLGAPVAAEASLMESGLDSLGSVELRNALSQQFELELPATLTFDHPSIAAMAKHIAGLVSPATTTVPEPDDAEEELSSMSDTASATSSTASSDELEPATSVQTPQATSAVLGQVAEAVASVLGSAVASDAPLMEVGLDSLGAVELRNTLSQQFELDLPATFTYDYPTVQAMSACISSLLGLASRTGEAEVQSVTGQLLREQRMVKAPRAESEYRPDVQAITGLSVRWAGTTCLISRRCLFLAIQCVLDFIT